MSYKQFDVHIRGVAPMLMHNGQLANPLNYFAKELKKISGKRKKTEDDHAEMAHIEFLGGLYVDGEGRPAVPGEVLEGVIIKGAMDTRKGKQARAAVIVDGNFPLIYDGPKEPEKLFQDENFRHAALVTVQKNRIVRTRPKFNKWELKFKVHYLPDMVNESDVVQFIEAGGRVSGIGDYRPKFGRYEVVSTSAAA